MPTALPGQPTVAPAVPVQTKAVPQLIVQPGSPQLTARPVGTNRVPELNLDLRPKGDAPASFTAAVAGPFAIALNWQDVPGALEYRVYRRLENAGVPVVRTVMPLAAGAAPAPLKSAATRDGSRLRVRTGEAGGARFTDAGLLPGTTFEYQIEAVYPDTILSGKTAAVSVTTPPPPPVTGLTAKSVGVKTPQDQGYRVELTWAPAPGATRYQISRHQNQMPIETVAGSQSAAEQPATSYAYIDDRHIGENISDRIVGQEKYYFGVPAGNYYYQVLPVYLSGTVERIGDKATAPGVTIDIPTTVVDARPAGTGPSGVTAVATGPQSIKVSWNDIPSAIHYRVYRSSSATGSFLGIQDLPLTTPRLAAQSYTDGWRAPGGTYYYKVEAFYPDSGPGQSQIANATTPVAAAVSGLKGTGSVLNAYLTWNPSPGVIGYYIYRDGKDIAHLAGQASYLSGQWIAPDTSYSDQLTSSGTYSYKVVPFYTYSAEEVANLASHPSVSVRVFPPPIWGFADTHTHPFANLASGGRMFWGKAFGPIDSALAICEPAHGVGGIGDIIGNFQAGVRLNHRTGGAPNFDGWPNWKTFDHQQMYSDWIYRAYQGGLRLIVALAVNNSTICSVANKDTGRTCDDMEAAVLQIEAAKAMEKYTDSVSGGPGKGWFHIAYSPEQARQIIYNGGLAVVLGVEVDRLFGCGVGKCDAKAVDVDLSTLAARGVRHVFPVHLADNAFGGYALSGGFMEQALFKLNSKVANDDLLKEVDEEDCSAGGYGQACNKRGLTDLGDKLIRGLMRRGMIIDIDHMSKHTTDAVFAITSPAHYPVVGGHTGFVATSIGSKKSERDKTEAQLVTMQQDGGMVSVGVNAGAAATYTPSWRGAVPNDCDESSKTFAQGYLYAVDKMGGPSVAAVGLATDQFLNDMEGPRFDGHCSGQSNSTRVTYPITVRPGVTLGQSQIGNRAPFDYNTDGLAHYGLLPDFVQDLKNDGLSNSDLAPLYRSAEGYIRMWERAVAYVPVP